MCQLREMLHNMYMPPVPYPASSCCSYTTTTCRSCKTHRQGCHAAVLSCPCAELFLLVCAAVRQVPLYALA